MSASKSARRVSWCVAIAAVACTSETVKPAAGANAAPPAQDASVPSDKASFFVSSDTSTAANLGGLSGADARCARLAAAAKLPKQTWRAYLSVEHGDGGPIDARDRIGAGPWYNVRGVKLADDLASLHARTGDADVFLDEHGDKIPGQWAGSPAPVQHDVLTGSASDGTVLAGKTCEDWTSESATEAAQVGHTDGLGPNMSSSAPYSSWNSAHANGGCNDTAPLGGAGRIYCFAVVPYSASQ
ncbi:MAG TPA: hypothetical protein VHC69_11810 [Polyangiaceae bacterium]|nr:hypothetical protein [Polyangiaceae bacterium]